MLSTLEILPPLACGELDASFSFQARYAAQTKAQEWLKALRPPRGKEEVQEKTGAFVNGKCCPVLMPQRHARIGVLYTTAGKRASLNTTFFFTHASTFQLLDKLWSQVSSLLRSGSCLKFLSRIGFSNLTARRFFIKCC